MENAPVAFAVVVAAGLSTTLGAAVVFIPSMHKYATQKVLAGSLAFAAGVMVYVSFVEIFQKSVGSFLDAGYQEKHSNALATLCFFAGVGGVLGLNKLIDMAIGGHHHSHHRGHNSTEADGSNKEPMSMAPGVCDSGDVVENIARISRMEAEHQELLALEKVARELGLETWDDTPTSPTRHSPNQSVASATNTRSEKDGDIDLKREGTVDAEQPLERTDEETCSDRAGDNDEEEKQKLVRMGLNTALAIALHNFPEGLATFVALLADPTIGFVLAIAIALHNIPEGLCVALPVYYATKNKWKAFLWALLSGLSEPFAALLGWIVLASVFSHVTYAALFGIVAGMMVIISVRELLPTALRYDPSGNIVVSSFIGGMALMALSLVLTSL